MIFLCYLQSWHYNDGRRRSLVIFKPVDDRVQNIEGIGIINGHSTDFIQIGIILYLRRLFSYAFVQLFDELCIVLIDQFVNLHEDIHGGRSRFVILLPFEQQRAEIVVDLAWVDLREKILAVLVLLVGGHCHIDFV
jgi:hypothetical protein